MAKEDKGFAGMPEEKHRKISEEGAKKQPTKAKAKGGRRSHRGEE